MNNLFVNPSLNLNNLDNFIIRRSIYLSLLESYPYFGSRVVDVGCGRQPYKDDILKKTQATEYLGVDFDSSNRYGVEPDILWDGENLPFPSSSVETVLCTEVLEHVFYPTRLLLEINRVMKPGGHLIVSTPFVWNLHEEPYDYYRYTPYALNRMFEESKFEVVRELYYGGWRNFLFQSIGLWMLRGQNRKLIKKIFSPLLFLLIKYFYEMPKVALKHEFRYPSISIGYFFILKKVE